MQQGVKFQGARASNSTLCLCVGVGRSETGVCRSETTPSQTCGPARIPLHTGSSSVRPSGGERSAKHRPSSGASALKNSVVTTRLHTRLRSGLDRVSPAGRIQGRDPGEPKTQRFMRRGRCGNSKVFGFSTGLSLWLRHGGGWGGRVNSKRFGTEISSARERVYQQRNRRLKWPTFRVSAFRPQRLRGRFGPGGRLGGLEQSSERAAQLQRLRGCKGVEVDR